MCNRFPAPVHTAVMLRAVLDDFGDFSNGACPLVYCNVKEYQALTPNVSQKRS